jgi:hypothetical protein
MSRLNGIALFLVIYSCAQLEASHISLDKNIKMRIGQSLLLYDKPNEASSRQFTLIRSIKTSLKILSISFTIICVCEYISIYLFLNYHFFLFCVTQMLLGV